MSLFKLEKQKFVQSIFNIVILLVFLLITSGCNNKSKENTIDESNEEEYNELIDIDLTKMSNTMIYAEVNNIVQNPTSYLGKRIKIFGKYSSSYYEPTNKYYSYVIVEDATACCVQGIEFDLVGHSYPDEYPNINEDIVISGIFSKYEELGYTYFYLSVNSLDRN